MNEGHADVPSPVVVVPEVSEELDINGDPVYDAPDMSVSPAHYVEVSGGVSSDDEPMYEVGIGDYSRLRRVGSTRKRVSFDMTRNLVFSIESRPVTDREKRRAVLRRCKGVSLKRVFREDSDTTSSCSASDSSYSGSSDDDDAGRGQEAHLYQCSRW